MSSHQGHQQQASKCGYIHVFTKEEHDVIVNKVQGTFSVQTKQRTTQQNNAIRKCQRNKCNFSIQSGNLYFRDKKVVTEKDLPKTVRKQFFTDLGAGSRQLHHELKEKCANISERKIKACLKQSKHYQQQYVKFTNTAPTCGITAKCVGERWQVDLMDMHPNTALYQNKQHRYILSVLDVFSRHLILRPLARKLSSETRREIEKIIAEHGAPNIVQCDQGTEFKGQFASYLKGKGVNMIRSRPYNPKAQGKVEVSHRTVRRKIQFKMRSNKGFNWAAELHVIQESI